MPLVVVDFLDMSRAMRAWVVADMRRAFGREWDESFGECEWPARWWFSQVVALDAAGAIILPPKGMRPAYLDKLWTCERGRGHGDRMMNLLVGATGTLHWRTTSAEWYRNWAFKRGVVLHCWPHGDYYYARAGPPLRSWEAEDAARDWLTMPSAWREPPRPDAP